MGDINRSTNLAMLGLLEAVILQLGLRGILDVEQLLARCRQLAEGHREGGDDLTARILEQLAEDISNLEVP